MYPKIQMAVCVLVAGSVALTSVLARDPQPPASANSQDPGAPAKAGAKLDKSTFPEAIEKLRLSDEQRKQVRDLLDRYNAEIDAVWKDFTRSYLDTIALESTLLAAIEDTLDDSQREQIRAQRARTAHGAARDDRSRRSDGRPDRQDDRSRSADPTAQRDSVPGGAVEEEVVIVGITLRTE